MYGVAMGTLTIGSFARSGNQGDSWQQALEVKLEPGILSGFTFKYVMPECGSSDKQCYYGDAAIANVHVTCNH